MNWNRTLILFTAILLFMQCGVQQPKEEIDELADIRQSKYLMEVEQLLSIINHDTIVILDLQKHEDYQIGHLPNAINIWRTELNNSSFPYDGMMPDKALFERVLQEKGVPANAFLVLYDNRGSCEATRLWWLLRHYGYEKVAILNGGTQGWQKLVTTESTRTRGTFQFPEQANVAVNSSLQIDELVIANSKDEYLILDTRSRSEYMGETLKAGALWEGSIPNSINIDWMEGLDMETYRFKEVALLKEIYEKVLNDERMKVTYCHSGVRSTHTFFILTELLGHKNVKNYDGSWVEWTHHFTPELVN